MPANQTFELVGNAKRQAPEWGEVPVQWIHAIIIIYYYRVNYCQLLLKYCAYLVFNCFYIVSNRLICPHTERDSTHRQSLQVTSVA